VTEITTAATGLVSYQPWMLLERGFYVYRAWDKDDKVIYVGMVGTKGMPASLQRRLGQHKRNADWWLEVARIDWAEFSSTETAYAEEGRQIAEHLPIHNQRRLPGPDAPRRRGPTPRNPPDTAAGRQRIPAGRASNDQPGLLGAGNPQGVWFAGKFYKSTVYVWPIESRQGT
jgi:hypothetical protein